MADSTPAPAPAPATDPKPGYKTSEFWLKLAAIALTALFASGVIPTSGPAATITAIAATMLGALGYTVSRSLVKAAALLILVGALAAPQMACGGSQASRSATISSVDNGVRAAIAALRSYEHTKSEALIASARNLEEGKASLAALRTKTEPAWHAMELAIAALDSATTVNDDTSLHGAQKALDDALAAYAALTGGNP